MEVLWKNFTRFEVFMEDLGSIKGGEKPLKSSLETIYLASGCFW
jgi:hypothetical protein